VPGNFRFTLKGSRHVTHLKKLNQTEEAVKKFHDRAGLLKGKLGCILWQLPGNQHKDIAKLEKFCRTLSGDFRNVMEFRHNSWFLESPKFSRHAGLDPASRRSNQPKRNWIPAFAGMTELKL
jgi:uncharacterized protein YecE (DUF72 family)